MKWYIYLLILIGTWACKKNTVSLEENLPSNTITIDSFNTDTLTNTKDTLVNNKQKSYIKLLCLGDSYTKGEGVPTVESWPYLLQSDLVAEDIIIDSLLVIAQTGWRTDNLKQAISTKLTPNDQFDYVSLLIGVNDQYQKVEISNYPVAFEGLLKTAITFAGNDTTKVFVISIPDYGVTPFGASNEATISQEIAAYNDINKSIAAKYHIQYFDITPISKMAKTDLTLLAPDQLHPSGKMYQLWVDKIVPYFNSSEK